LARSRRRGRIAPSLSDLLVLDAQGLAGAAGGDPTVQAWLERAQELDADVIVSAVTLAEVIRGEARDARCNSVVKAVDVWPADAALGRAAGALLGRASSDRTVDAVVAATVLAARQHHGTTRCVVLTSDPDDLTALLADSPDIRVVTC
jgi:predicted nucleic acid-binding protein